MVPFYRCSTMFVLPLALGLFSPLSALPIQVAGPTTYWNVVRLGSSNRMDYFNDEQTGRPESDIVGNASHPGFYWAFDDGGTPDIHTDGNLGFRVRLGSDLPQAGVFNSVLTVGMDGDSDGSIDLFAGVENNGSGGANLIRFWDPGTGANTSPSTTSIKAPLNPMSYGETAANYNFAAVTQVNDPVATVFDLDGDGVNDFFLTFSVPFADVVFQMANRRKGPIILDDRYVVRLVVLTATQDNTFNGDLGGVPANYDPTKTWEELGIWDRSLPPSGTEQPEPATIWLAAAAAALLLRRRRQ